MTRFTRDLDAYYVRIEENGTSYYYGPYAYRSAATAARNKHIKKYGTEGVILTASDWVENN